MVVGVVAHAVAQEARQPLAAGGSRRRAAARPPPAPARASRATGSAPWRAPRAAPAACAARRAPPAGRCSAQRAVVRREHRVRLARLGPHLARLVDRREPRMRAGSRRPPQSPAPRSPRARAKGVTSAAKCTSSAPTSSASAGSSRSGGPCRITSPPPRSRSDASRSRQALEHELRPRPGGVAAVQQPVVEAEDRHHAIVAVERRAQRGVVVEAQVAPEPDDRRSPRGYDPAAAPGSAGHPRRQRRRKRRVLLVGPAGHPDRARAPRSPRSARTMKPSSSSRSASPSPSPSAGTSA